jgi:hypothetical protein
VTSEELVEAVAKGICRSGKFETGEGTCALLCMEFLGDPRKNGCGHAVRIHGDRARAAISLTLEAVEAIVARDVEEGDLTAIELAAAIRDLKP